jgi:hypothetical protein
MDTKSELSVKDKMGILFNKFMDNIKESGLTVSQVNLTLDFVKHEILDTAEKIYINRGEDE